MLDKPMGMSEAARAAGCTDAALYYHQKKRPELFVPGPRGLTITLENLGKLGMRAPMMKRVKAAQAQRPAAPPKPTVRQATKRIGWWCKKCQGLMSDLFRYCKCLDAVERPAQAAKHRAANWLPASVELSVTLGAQP